MLQRDARAIAPLVTSRLAKDFLKAAANLPSISPRTVYLDEPTKTYLSEAAANTLRPRRNKQTQAHRSRRVVLLEYQVRLAAGIRPTARGARPVGLESVSGKKILDFGYGTIGHLRLLAAQGALVTGVDVDPLLSALYVAPGDQGIVKNHQGPDGQIRLIERPFSRRCRHENRGRRRLRFDHLQEYSQERIRSS